MASNRYERLENYDDKLISDLRKISKELKNTEKSLEAMKKSRENLMETVRRFKGDETIRIGGRNIREYGVLIEKANNSIHRLEETVEVCRIKINKLEKMVNNKKCCNILSPKRRNLRAGKTGELVKRLKLKHVEDGINDAEINVSDFEELRRDIISTIETMYYNLHNNISVFSEKNIDDTLREFLVIHNMHAFPNTVQYQLEESIRINRLRQVKNFKPDIEKIRKFTSEMNSGKEPSIDHRDLQNLFNRLLTYELNSRIIDNVILHIAEYNDLYCTL